MTERAASDDGPHQGEGGGDAPREVAALREADNRLLRSVDGLTSTDLAGPSVLPHWSRAHVVAHLALHAEGSSRVLEGILVDHPAPMYDSAEARAAAIDELADEPRDELWDRLLGATARFRALLDRLDPTHWQGWFERFPDGPHLPVRELPVARLREVEVHHADLAVTYGPDDWPREFAMALLERTLADRAGSGPLALRAIDVGHTWWLDQPAEDAVVVTGPVARLAWWLAGRGDRAGLHASAGRPPSLGRWR